MKLSQRSHLNPTEFSYSARRNLAKLSLRELSKEFNLLWFDLENGVDTLLKLPQEQKERIEVVTLPTQELSNRH